MNPDDERKVGRPGGRPATDAPPAAPEATGTTAARRTAERRGSGSPANAARAPFTERGPERRAGPVLNRPSTRHGRGAPSADERRAALRSMLELADSRRARAVARRHERPVMAPGVTVQILSGPRRDALAIIVDADYITNRVLVRVPNEAEPVWVGFADVAKAASGADGADPEPAAGARRSVR